MMAANPNSRQNSIAHEPELVSVFDTMDEAEALVVQGFLESNGIETLLVNREAPQDVLPGVGGVAIRVRPEDAEEARDIIEAQRNAQPLAEESSEIENS
jgi:Putative prokaryotic signal transducing protein